MLVKLGIFAMLFIATQAIEVELRCPFSEVENPENECLRPKRLRKHFERHPDEKFRRPDYVGVQNRTIQVLEKHCCYEAHCLIKCGWSKDKIFHNRFDPIFPKGAGAIVNFFPGFFKEIDRAEIKLLEKEQASEKILEKWAIYLKHLDQLTQSPEMVEKLRKAEKPEEEEEFEYDDEEDEDEYYF